MYSNNGHPRIRNIRGVYDGREISAGRDLREILGFAIVLVSSLAGIFWAVIALVVSLTP